MLCIKCLLNFIFTFDYSHVSKTGDIKHFTILEESGIAKGIRRIVAVTGEEAQQVNIYFFFDIFFDFLNSCKEISK
jgi:hypothetical protein